MEQQYDFLTSEHLAGYHNGYTEHCYECWRENCIIQAHRTVNLGRSLAYGRMQDEIRSRDNNICND